MQKEISRLIDAGFTREEALAIYGRFQRDGRLDEFELYVDKAEQIAMEGERDELDLL